jgi:broad specificity phosphatase PhoE
MRLIFVRHGESEANLLHEFSNRGWKYGLTDKGRLQAEILAARLKKFGVTRIYTSPLMRAVQTAEILSHELRASIVQAEALREYDVGIWEGSRDPAGWAEYSDVNEAWMLRGEYKKRMQGGESFEEIRTRFAGWLTELINLYMNASETFLLVGHGGLYRIMLPEVLTNISARFSLDHPLQNSGYVLAEVSARGLVCISWVGDGAELNTAM